MENFDRLVESILCEEYGGPPAGGMTQYGAMGAASAPGTEGGNEGGGAFGTYPQDGYGGDDDARMPTGFYAVSRRGDVKEFDDENSLREFLNNNSDWERKTN